MKRKWWAMIIGCILLAGLAACGEEDVKVVNKLPGEKTEDTSKDEQKEQGDESQKDALNGYIFEAEANGKTVSVSMDNEMKGILEQLGEAASYFESPSCAFEGLIDKTYTYEHFRIETYPDGETDRVSSVIFLDDIAETPEGIGIGMTKEDMEKAYGTEYEEKDGMVVYTKDGKHLSFLVRDGKIESVQYNSSVLDSQET